MLLPTLLALAAPLPQDFEVAPERIEWSQLTPARFDLTWLLPEENSSGGDLIAAMRALSALRFEVVDGDRTLRSFGDLVAAAHRQDRAGRGVWWAALIARGPEVLRVNEPAMGQLVLDVALYSDDWRPDREHDSDGLLTGASWNLAAEGGEPWTSLRVTPRAEQVAALLYADLLAIKTVEHDFRTFLEHVGDGYEYLFPLEGTYALGRDTAGRPFSTVDIRFEQDLPWPFSSYTNELNILNRFDDDGLHRCDIYSRSDDFHWLAGRDVFLPVTTSDGEWVAFLLVRQFGFDLDGVPDDAGDRRDALRGAVGNLKRKAERAWAERAARDGVPRNEPTVLDRIQVLGRR